MKFVTVILSLVAVINARPDVSHLPTGSYLPSGHLGESSGQFGSISSLGGQFGGGQTSFGGGQASLGGLGGQSSFGQTSFGSQSTFGGGSYEGHTGGIGVGGIGVGGGFQDQKHVYFFAAPEEESSGRLRIQIVPNSQRNTKIIFVKAPSYGAVQPEVIAPPSISEDKTLVYVLVKRPDHGGSISIPAGAGVKASKPEVYFIKYKSQQDARQLISGGLQGQQVGANVPDLGNEASFVRTLDSGVSNVGLGSTSFTSGTSQGTSIGSIGSHTSGSHSSGIFTSGTSGSSQYGPAGASGPY
ncbi:hypothetical protein PPYR_10000 [Photinus pyralis]|uniref:DUF243 domain-containing protein n=2 Tax=Photinus pyralis TaxID=7054 RepID=A0A5N4AF55_PHOPY|nr:pupal cuticle protein 36-like [Photinus pyralis]KAB0795939.1 hypothetical protein PPYR_10000 [Photinus pyralis]